MTDNLTDAEMGILAHGFTEAWGSELDDEDAEFIAADEEAQQLAMKYAEWIAPAVQKILDARGD